MALLPGTRLDRYEIRSLVGVGGMGEVYLAHDTQLERQVALKILPGTVAADHQRMRRFVQEARATSALNHPNILTIYEIGRANSINFIATEFVNGLNLRQHMKRGPMELREVLDVAVQVAAALAAAHATGIVHRDIKPENIMLRPDGYVKVLDFGIAKLTEKFSSQKAARIESGEVLDRQTANTLTGEDDVQDFAMGEAPTISKNDTDTGKIMGTAKYMSPEQARGLDVDARADIFSFGVVLYEMLAGVVPFNGQKVLEVIISILEQEPPPLTERSPGVPLELEKIVNKALAKDRERRYQSIEEMASELHNLQQEMVFKAKLENASSAASIAPRSVGSSRQLAAERKARPLTQVQSPPHRTPNNLPAQPTSLIGRDDEMAAIGELLLRGDVRLLTLSGPGGAGKTRLSTEVALKALDHFPDGVFLVSLDSINAPQLVASAVAQTLDLNPSAGGSLLGQLKQHIADKEMLLLMDNFEQVLPAASLIAELLAACQRLKMLVTSRAVLRLRGEHEFEVPPLALPDTSDLPAVEVLSQYSAIALFVERARAVQPEFSLSEENAQAVAEICAKLDGLPLAIELAAARLKLLSPEDMLARLKNRFKLLTGGARDLPARQQTMRGTIAWSYDLLDEDEKRLFRRISVFAGGCTLKAVEAVCGDMGEAEVEVLDVLTSLIDKSLLRQKEQLKGQTRFVLLETIREYGLDQLEQSGEAESLRRSHALHLLEFVERAENELTGPEQVAWLERINQEHDNLRAALRWAKESGEIEVGLRIAGALWRFWEVRGHANEGRGWLESLLKRSNTASPVTRAKAFSRAAALERDQGNYDQASMLFEKGLSLYQEIGDKWGIGQTLNGLGDMAQQQGDYERARARYEESLAIFRQTGNKLAVAYILNNLGNVARDQCDYEHATAFHEQALALFRQLGDKRALAVSLHNLGKVAQYQGNFERAAALQYESLAITREVGDKRAIGFALYNLGDIARCRGDYQEAVPLYEESLIICQEIGDKRSIAFCLEGLAEVACRQNDCERAACLFGAAEIIREAIGAPLPLVEQMEYERNVAAARASLDHETFTSLWEQGHNMTLDQAIAYALRSQGSD